MRGTTTVTVIKITQYVKDMEGVDVWFDVARLSCDCHKKTHYIEVTADSLSVGQEVTVVVTAFDENGLPERVQLAS